MSGVTWRRHPSVCRVFRPINENRRIQQRKFSGNRNTWTSFLHDLEEKSVNVVVSHGDFIRNVVLRRTETVRNGEIFVAQHRTNWTFEPLEDMFTRVIRGYGRKENTFCATHKTPSLPPVQPQKLNEDDTTVFLVRHLQSCANVANPVFQFRQRMFFEPYGTLTGAEQSLTAGMRINAALAKYFPSGRQAKLWCSYFRRAMQTMKLISTEIEDERRENVIQRDTRIGEHEKFYDRAMVRLGYGGKSQTSTTKKQSDNAAAAFDRWGEGAVFTP